MEEEKICEETDELVEDIRDESGNQPYPSRKKRDQYDAELRRRWRQRGCTCGSGREKDGGRAAL
jgi:hypothetical protein